MKKIKFMMPALAIASTAAAITPFVTSCNKGNSKTFQITVKGKQQKYKVQYTPAKKQKFTSISPAVEAVCNTINSNVDVFFDDLFYALSTQRPPYSMDDNATITVSNVSMKPAFVYEDAKYAAFLLSMDIKMFGDDDDGGSGAHSFDLNFSLKNMPYVLGAVEHSSSGSGSGGSGSETESTWTFTPAAYILVDGEEEAKEYMRTLFALSNFDLGFACKVDETVSKTTTTILDIKGNINDIASLEAILGSEIVSFFDMVCFSWELNYFKNWTFENEERR